MIKEATASAASAQEAVEAAKKALCAPENADVQTEIIGVEEEKKKVLGLFGGSPAKFTAKAWYDESPYSNVENYICAILTSLGVENPAISFEEADDELKITLDCGDDYGSVIGRRGETLDAIQYLVRLVVNKGSEGYTRVSLNIGDYREKRENTLRALARKNAAKVKKYGRNVVLDPMNPYERRIIHTTIQEIEGVSSHSVGSDDGRKVVITLEEGFKPTNGGGYNRNRRGGRNDNYRGRRERAPRYEPEANNRPPLSDSSSASLYGKIEINK